MSQTIHVNLNDRGYDVRIGCTMDPGAFLSEGRCPRAMIVSDSNVDPLHGARCEQALRDRGLMVKRVVIPAGESSKTLAFLERLYHEAVQFGLDRHALVVALGGGMVGDLAGFMAATYLRGIRLVQIPTSLLAMVDSSVGGKTAVDLPEGKNLVGAFHQPTEVVADLTTLATLPEREYRSGLAEVVKYGVIWDADLFHRLEQDAAVILKRDLAVLETVVARCCEIKAEVVAIDEKESGIRQILNFGHTLAHALETESRYGGWLHGEAVSAGMVYAAEVSVLTGRATAEAATRVRSLLATFGLPIQVPRGGGEPWPALRARMNVDKKTRDGVPLFVLMEGLGAVVFGCETAEPLLEQAFRRCVTES